MLPTTGQIHKDKIISQLAIGYRNQMFVADRVFPNVQVAKKSDYFIKFLKGAFFRNEAKPRAPGTRAPRGGFPLSSDTYTAVEYAYGEPLPIEYLNQADAPLNLWKHKAMSALNKVLLAKEIKASSIVHAGSAFTNEEDAAGGWLGTVDGSGNTFITDVLAGKEAIRKLIGVNPNCMLMDSKTFNECKKEYTVLERIKYTGTQGKPADVTAETLAALFELEEVIVAGSIYSSDEEIVAGTDFTAVDLWETTATKGSALVFYRTKQPEIFEPSTGYCFNWKGLAGSENKSLPGDAFRDMSYYWEAAEKQFVIEASESFDFKITCADAGFLFTDTILT